MPRELGEVLIELFDVGQFFEHRYNVFPAQDASAVGPTYPKAYPKSS